MKYSEPCVKWDVGESGKVIELPSGTAQSPIRKNRNDNKMLEKVVLK